MDSYSVFKAIEEAIEKYHIRSALYSTEGYIIHDPAKTSGAVLLNFTFPKHFKTLDSPFSYWYFFIKYLFFQVSEKVRGFDLGDDISFLDAQEFLVCIYFLNVYEFFVSMSFLDVYEFLYVCHFLIWYEFLLSMSFLDVYGVLVSMSFLDEYECLVCMSFLDVYEFLVWMTF